MSLPKLNAKHPEIFFPSDAPVEWWYFTGHTKQYGFEFCIFKLSPEILRVFPLTKILKKPFYVMHASITDKANNTFKSYQEISRKAEIGKGLSIKFKDASLKLANKEFHLRYKDMIELTAMPMKKLVKYGNNGHINYKTAKSHETYYVSCTKNKLTGKILSHDVKGIAWMDHQKSNIPKKPEIMNWDWFGIMLANEEIMVYSLNGGKEKYAAIIDKNGNTKSTSKVTIKALSYWKSPKTKITYPASWNLQFLNYSLIVKPLLKDQEMNTLKTTPTTYWEGACNVGGKKSNRSIEGNAYVELVGYDNRFLTKLAKKILT